MYYLYEHKSINMSTYIYIYYIPYILHFFGNQMSMQIYMIIPSPLFGLVFQTATRVHCFSKKE